MAKIEIKIEDLIFKEKSCINISLNGSVTFIPNKFGWNIWENYYKKLGVDILQHKSNLEMTLWEMAHIFGKSLYNGCEMPFETSLLQYRDNL